MNRTAKLFMNGRSQAVRLPSIYRFEGDEVFIRKDPDSGDIILSKKPASWDDYFVLVDSLDIPDDFMSDRVDDLPQVREDI